MGLGLIIWDLRVPEQIIDTAYPGIRKRGTVENTAINQLIP